MVPLRLCLPAESLTYLVCNTSTIQVMADWNPEQYRRFAAERAQPFHDLLALIEPGSIERAADLGCGPGN